MSHFTVLVIGDNPTKQLKSYDENIEMPAFETGIVSKSEIESMIDYYVKNKGFVFVNNFDELYKKYGNDWNGSSWRKYSDGTYHEYSTRNPNSKWDWYELGGRWTGFFKLKDKLIGKVGKPGLMTDKAKLGYADQAFKKEIDFDAMIKEDGEKAEKEYDDAMKILSSLPINESWDSVRERIKDIGLARAFYNGQPRCKTSVYSVDRFLISKEHFIKNARENAISTFAIVKDGQWFEKGEMGWWACISNEKNQEEWNKEFNQILDELSDNTLLSLYDCHI